MTQQTMQVEAIYSPTIMSGPVVRFQTGYLRGTYREIISGKDRNDWSAEISASREGVLISGTWPTIDDHASLKVVADLIDRAWKAHAAIRQARYIDHLPSPEHAVAKRIVEEFNAEHGAGAEV